MDGSSDRSKLLSYSSICSSECFSVYLEHSNIPTAARVIVMRLRYLGNDDCIWSLRMVRVSHQLSLLVLQPNIIGKVM